MAPRFIAVFDLDGTLLRPGGYLLAEDIGRLNKLIDAGMLAGYASARSWEHSRDLVSGIHWTMPGIQLNGAVVADISTGSVLRHVPISADVAEAVLPIVCRRDLAIRASFVDTRGNLISVDLCAGTMHSRGVPLSLPRRYGRTELRCPERCQAGSLVQIVGRGCLGAVKATMAEIDGQLGNRTNVHVYPDAYNPGIAILDICAADAGKWQAVQWAIGTCGLDGYRCYAFGDGDNDLDMITGAHVGIAVGAATELLIRHADIVVSERGPESVLGLIEHLWDTGNV